MHGKTRKTKRDEKGERASKREREREMEKGTIEKGRGRESERGERKKRYETHIK